MATHSTPVLKKLSESEQVVAKPDQDVRGWKVTAADGDELGTVEDLLIDEHESKVRFLLVEHGGFLGIGQKKTFIPVDAVVDLQDDHVRISQSREHAAGAPAYDPELADYPDDVFQYYGMTPFWGPGYVYPPYPYYR